MTSSDHENRALPTASVNAPECVPIEDLLAAVGYAVVQVGIYGPDHRLSIEAISKAAGSLTGYLEHIDRLPLKMSDGVLLAHAQPVPSSNHLVAGLARSCSVLGNSEVTIARGVTTDEFRRFILELNRAAHSRGTDRQSLIKRIERGFFANIRCRAVRLVEVGEDEAVVSREMASAGLSEMAAGTHPPAAHPPSSGDGHEPGLCPDEASLSDRPEFRMFVASLSQSTNKLSTGAEEWLQAQLEDPDLLTETLLTARRVLHEHDHAPAEVTLSAMVRVCLERMLASYRQHLGAGKPGLARRVNSRVKAFEKRITQWLAGRPAEEVESEAGATKEAFAFVRKQMSIEGAVAEYARNQKRLESSKSKVRKVLEESGEHAEVAMEVAEALQARELDGTHSTLPEDDLPSEPESLGEGDLNAVDLAHIAAILMALPFAEPPAEDASPRSLADILDTVSKGMDRAFAEVNDDIERIETLAGAANSTSEPGETAGDRVPVDRLSRAELMKAVADVANGLLQPLAVMNTSLGVLVEGHLGQLSRPQMSLIELMTRNHRQLEMLTARLAAIS